MKLSVVSHYYNNVPAVERLLSSFREMSGRHPDAFDFVLVDDHSRDLVPLSNFNGIPNLRVFRILDDIQWNQPGARNVGASQAVCEKVLLLDVDHVVDSRQTDALLDAAEALQPGQMARFNRTLIQKGQQEKIASHLNGFMISKADFVRVGGYEELFSGHYGYDDKYFQVCCRKAGFKEVLLNIDLIMERYPTKGLSRDKSHNQIILDDLLKRRVFIATKSGQSRYELIYSSKTSLSVLLGRLFGRQLAAFRRLRGLARSCG